MLCPCQDTRLSLLKQLSGGESLWLEGLAGRVLGAFLVASCLQQSRTLYVNFLCQCVLVFWPLVLLGGLTQFERHRLCLKICKVQVKFLMCLVWEYKI